MATPERKQLAEDIRKNIATLKAVCQGLDEATAARRPSGRWSPKEILSHLCGQEGPGYDPFVRAFLEQDTPTINIRVEDPFFSETRAAMTVAELLAVIEREYGKMADLAESLSEEALARKARIPQLKDSPLGEYPSLGTMIDGLGRYHLQDHTEHLRQVLRELGAATAD